MIYPIVSSSRSRTPPLIAYVSLFLLGLLLFSAAESLRDYAAQFTNREISRLTSPDRRVDAVLLKSIQGNRISLDIVPRGEPADASDSMLHGSFNVPPSISWSRPQLVTMRYVSGCIDDLTNVWHAPALNDGHYYVELRLTAQTDYPCLQVHTPLPIASR